MSIFDFSVIGFQIALPIALLAWLVASPGKSLMQFLARSGFVVLFVLTLCLVPIWLVPPWWTGWIYLVVAVATIAGRLFSGAIPTETLWPGSRAARISTIGLLTVSLGLAGIAASALAGRAVPERTVELAFPMGPGSYLVANGGSTETVNGHLMTLDPQTDRQRAYRGQSYAVDLIKLGNFGFRAPGWRPRDAAAYEIFGEPVYAPCSGEILSADDSMPDMPVPEMDTSRLEGNHVFIDCGDFGVLLAHFRRGSLAVSAGDFVTRGEAVGEAGNSGQSSEPHLHVHAQRIPDDGPLLSGEPLFITLNGQFLLRNERVQVP